MNGIGHAIAVRALRQSFGAHHVLDGIDLDVPAGSTLALLGPSGCGKSTLLKLLAGMTRPDGGEIFFDAKLVASQTVWLPPEQRSLGMVFQDYALWPHMSVAGNVGFPLEMRQGAKSSKAERAERVAAALARVGLEGIGARRPASLSGGQQQRVALARAIVAEPRMLLFDEPLSNLDSQLRTTLCTEIGTLLAHLGTTAVYVTHDRGEAEALAHRIVTLNAGRVQSVTDR